jgi:hypothetical protein
MSACWGSTDMQQTTAEMQTAMIAGLKAERETIAGREPWRRGPTPMPGRSRPSCRLCPRRAAVSLARAQSEGTRSPEAKHV